MDGIDGRYSPSDICPSATMKVSMAIDPGFVATKAPVGAEGNIGGSVRVARSI
jgi:hypothetical protein